MREGWKTVSLGNISEISYGYTTKASFENVGPKFLRITDINDGAVNWWDVPTCQISDNDLIKHRLKEDDIVFARTGATTGKSYQITNHPEAVAASYLIRLRLQSQRTLPAFVYLYFQTKEYWDSIESRTTGSTQGGFNASKLADLPIPLPPLPEQKRIVAILDKAFEGIDKAIVNTEKNLADARELYNNYLNAVLTKNGEGWDKVTLGEVCKFENGDRGKNYPGRKTFVQTGIPFINAGHINDDSIDMTTMNFIPRERFNLLSNGKIQEGDLLFCLRGSIGKFAIVEGLNEGAIASSLVIVRPSENLNKYFLAAYFGSSICVDMIKQYENGVAQPNLSARNLRFFEIPLPPINNQLEIVAKLFDLRNQVRKLQHIYHKKLSCLAELKQSLLQKAFTGELTATPEPVIKNEAVA